MNFFNLGNQVTSKKLLTAVLLIMVGAGGRLLLLDYPNIETVTVATILAGALLGGVWTIVIGLVIVGLTDIVIGNSVILVYTWSAWAVMGFFGLLARRGVGVAKSKNWQSCAKLTGVGLAGNVFFYLWTNFGVWHIGGLYPPTASGLLTSYIMGLPFLKMQLISTLIFVPTISYVALKLWSSSCVYASTLLAPRPVRSRVPRVLGARSSSLFASCRSKSAGTTIIGEL